MMVKSPSSSARQAVGKEKERAALAGGPSRVFLASLP